MTPICTRSTVGGKQPPQQQASTEHKHSSGQHHNVRPKDWSLLDSHQPCKPTCTILVAISRFMRGCNSSITLG